MSAIASGPRAATLPAGRGDTITTYAGELLPVARLLVVEDDDTLRSVLQDLLTDEGYLVATAENGATALALLDKGASPPGFDPHVILLDMRLPVMDGPAFAAAYRARPGRHAPIIVLTASTELAAASREISPADVIGKPFDLTDLLVRVAKVVSSASPTAASPTAPSPPTTPPPASAPTGA
jgi:CheY-like chemotaxis protein